MFSKIKKVLYFPIAQYFRFFAQIQLAIWKPRIVVITGSSGKTTLLNLLESQIKERGEYSHQANSSFGIPFDILGLKRKTLTAVEWPFLFFQTPINAFKKIHTKNLYFVEADCDRMGEGSFLATLLKPEVTCWLSSTKTHSVNFPSPVEENIAREFSEFLKSTSKLVIINGDSSNISNNLPKITARIEKVYKKSLQEYKINKNRSEYKIAGKIYKLDYLLPEETFYQIQAMVKILNYLNIPQSSFKNFNLPPGRSSIFAGIKQTTLIDSTYNADLESMKVMLNMFDKLDAENKWLVLGDMVEQGSLEKSEHQKLALIISKMKLNKIILVGPRLAKYTYPKLNFAKSFDQPLEALNYLRKNINGGEIIFFKGARFLEGVIEHLLTNKTDIDKLCRREKIWQDRRKKWRL